MRKLRKIIGLASLLMIAGITTTSFADALSEGKIALEQKKYSDVEKELIAKKDFDLTKGHL